MFLASRTERREGKAEGGADRGLGKSVIHLIHIKCARPMNHPRGECELADSWIYMSLVQ